MLNANQAIKIALAINGLILLFHFLVLLQVIPFTIVWAGRLKSVNEMRQFEGVSIAINLFFGIVLLLRGGFLKTKIPIVWLNGILWIFLIVFALNTVGNLFAARLTEMLVFTPITFILAYLCWCIVRNKTS